MLEEQKEVPTSALGPILRLLVALADTKVNTTQQETADRMPFPFKTHRKQDDADDGLIRAPPECFDVPKVSRDVPQMSQKCRPYPQFTEDIFDKRVYGGLDKGNNSRVSRYASPDQRVFELKPGQGLGLLFGARGREAVVRLPKETVPPLEATLSRVDGARHLRLPINAAAKRVADEQKDEGYHSPMSSLNPPSSAGLLQVPNLTEKFWLDDRKENSSMLPMVMKYWILETFSIQKSANNLFT